MKLRPASRRLKSSSELRSETFLRDIHRWHPGAYAVNFISENWVLVGLDGLEPTTSVLSGRYAKTNRNSRFSDAKQGVLFLLFSIRTEVRFEVLGKALEPYHLTNDGHGIVQRYRPSGVRIVTSE